MAPVNLDIRRLISISATPQHTTRLEAFLVSNPHVNHLWRAAGRYDFAAEITFANHRQEQDFLDKLASHNPTETTTVRITEDVRREAIRLDEK